MRVTAGDDLASLTRVAPLLLAVLCLFLAPSRALAEEDELRSLQLFNGAEFETVSTGRSPRPASQTAENITVVTASEIEAMNAHTLADVLYTLTGVQLEMLRTPGTVVNLEIQGSVFKHIMVLLDNVPLNNLVDNFSDVSSVPVQMIERIEIVKGAASSSWGSALGGVINIITKSPQVDRPAGGVLSASFGERGTADGRAEATGTIKNFGYYLTGGKLRSDGLLPNNMADLNNVYAKLRYDLPVRGSLTVTTDYIGNSAGQLSYAALNVNQDTRQLISTVSVNFGLTEGLQMELAARLKRLETEISTLRIADDSLLKMSKDEEQDTGGSAKLSWHDQMHRLVFGVDYDNVRAHVTYPQIHADAFNRSTNRVGVYLNDTLSLGDFAVTPSARFDRTGSEELFSPSFGVTYALTENTVLRGYTARGYSLVSLNRTDSTEKVWTSQVGIESSDIPYLWLKGTLFRNDTWNITVTDQNGNLSKHSQLKQGVELEARTLPVMGVSLSVGYTFIAATDENSSALSGVPRHTLDLGGKYENSSHLRALLTGHYVDWNEDQATSNGKYGAVIWDMHLGQKVFFTEHRFLELFFSARNLFNGKQYLNLMYHNAGRWLEGGIRCGF